MTITASFVRGGNRLTLTGAYAVREFIPPSPNPTFAIAEGSSLNRLDGNKLISEKYQDREIVFQVRVTGTNTAAVEANIRRLTSFLNQYRLTGDRLYFEIKHSDLPTPLWGQFGAPLRYEVVTAETYISDDWAVELARSSGVRVGVNLRVKPFAEGIKQQACLATGGILEDAYGCANPRGTMIGEGTTNLSTNPIFANTTWNTGWTALRVLASKNTDAHYTLYGTTSVRLAMNSTTNGLYYQDLTLPASVHTISIYLKKADGSPVTSDDACVYYMGDVASKYVALGDGWYQVSAQVTGIGSSTATGVCVWATGNVVYLSGMQVEQKTYATPMCYGDLLGCAWTSTAHASTSTRTGGVLKLLTTTYPMTDRGAIAWTWKAGAGTLGTGHFWNTSNWNCRYVGTTSLIMTGGTASATASVTGFVAGSTYAFHQTFTGGSAFLYLNGSAVASMACGTVLANSGTLYIGNQAGTGNYTNGCYLGFGFYPYMSAAEVATHYQALTPWISADTRIDPLPYLWTTAGDGVVQNCEDATRHNYAVVGGIIGDQSPRAELGGTTTNGGDLWLSNFSTPEFIPHTYFRYDASGSAESSCSGGSCGNHSMDGMAAYHGAAIDFGRFAPHLSEKDFLLLARLRSTNGSAIGMRVYKIFDQYPTMDQNAGFTGTAFGLTSTQTLQAPSYIDYAAWNMPTDTTITYDLTGYIGMGVPVEEDFVMLMTRPLMKTNIGGTFLMNSQGQSGGYSLSNALSRGNVYGDPFSVDPNRYNILSFAVGGTNYWTVSGTIAFQTMTVRPRWGVV